MKVAVFGGTGAIGSHAIGRALEAGHTVTAFARDASRLPRHAALAAIEGSLDDRAAVAAAISGADGVIDAIGPQANTRTEMERVVDSTRGILDAMRRVGARRIVLLSGAAVSIPGERKRAADAIASRVVRLFARWIVETRQREVELVRQSGLEWIALRPARVEDGPLTRSYRLGDIPIGPRSRISRADLGHALVAQLSDDTHLNSAPFISY